MQQVEKHRQWKRSAFNKGTCEPNSHCRERRLSAAIFQAGAQLTQGEEMLHRDPGAFQGTVILSGRNCLVKKTAAHQRGPSNRAGCCLRSSTWRIQLEHTSCACPRVTTCGKLPLEFVCEGERDGGCVCVGVWPVTTRGQLWRVSHLQLLNNPFACLSYQT